MLHPRDPLVRGPRTGCLHGLDIDLGDASQRSWLESVNAAAGDTIGRARCDSIVTLALGTATRQRAARQRAARLTVCSTANCYTNSAARLLCGVTPPASSILLSRTVAAVDMTGVANASTAAQDSVAAAPHRKLWSWHGPG